jgi:hypothetical protein
MGELDNVSKVYEAEIELFVRGARFSYFGRFNVPMTIRQKKLFAMYSDIARPVTCFSKC